MPPGGWQDARGGVLTGDPRRANSPKLPARRRRADSCMRSYLRDNLHSYLRDHLRDYLRGSTREGARERVPEGAPEHLCWHRRATATSTGRVQTRRTPGCGVLRGDKAVTFTNQPQMLLSANTATAPDDD
ncbi:hypothetical protein ACUY3K_07860 [Corynebacterium uberis]|uniref:hypothetical protein n=1 Tax=Corynebacterium TaxID=1716 RepID=UPI001D09B052|nr:MULTISPECIES: hypothetical protein [Corynebacterium]UDL73322.1 hypothetical protein LH391_09550 [Corynebacterium uberis]UDL75800.1 hypothetical protein LH393_11380 [Corynebacterium uberis]UDL78013.1 hypothetical protein LH394_11370 [Corynebacterium uberis]UDL80295.1 hypothetical protein LH392_00265 [Corynebacterium uberis]UDL82431.1 hypothetical protein LH395_11380 [Corynebacterium uberis]